MVSDHIFKFYKLSGGGTEPPGDTHTSINPPATATYTPIFNNLVAEDFGTEDTRNSTFDGHLSTAESIPSSPVFKIHPSSTRSSSPVSLDTCHSTLPTITPAFTNLTPADMLKAAQIPSAAPPNVKRDKIKMTWSTLDDAKAWMEKEQQEKVFSFASKEPIYTRGAAVDWIKKLVYVCSRGASGGRKAYVKKYGRYRKVPYKSIGCKCLLRLTVYSDRVEGSYTHEHNHPLGRENARFTAISVSTRREIEAMLRSGMLPSKVLEHMHRSIYDERNSKKLHSRKSTRNDFISRADVRRIEKEIEQETICLAKGDGESVMLWVDKLRKEGYYVFLKTSLDAPPIGSSLEGKSFVLIIQTPYRADFWKKQGSLYAGIDATHNTTHYVNMSLFTLLARDRWGRGMPCAWMVSSNATEETISFFLGTTHTRFPDVVPEYFMTDKDHAQINTIKRHYPTSMVELCWWHVLHAWQKHFKITEFPELWDLLKTWVRITDEKAFQERWTKIRAAAPESIIEYLETYWLPIKEMWSAIHHTGRTVHQECDTNMLVEAWHHLLKGKFMQGKRNRRLDHLIYVLVHEAMPHFIHRHHRQKSGFEGGDLEVRERLRIQDAAKRIPEADVEQLDGDSDLFNVKSQTLPNTVYCVDLDAYDCTCSSFPLISLCKHILAVQLHFNELCEPILATDSDIICLDTFAPTDAEEPGQTTPNEDVQAPIATSSHDVKDDIIHSLSTLVHRISNLSPSKLDTDKFTALHDTISNFSRRLPSQSLLPPAKRIAPNQHSWPETAAVMGVQVKGKKRTAYPDAYSGGEKSGKRAKEDALSCQLGPTLVNRVLQPSQAATTSSTFIPACFNVTDTAALEALKRPQLFQLCDLYLLPKKGTNAEIVSRLIAYTQSSIQTYLPYLAPQ